MTTETQSETTVAPVETKVETAPVEKVEPKVKKRVANISKNAGEVTFVHAPFYNLANVRKAALSLITRASNDPAKVAAIKETLEVLLKVLKVRAKHGAEMRKKSIAAEKANDEARAKAAAEAREHNAKQGLKDAEKQVSHFSKILKALKG